MGNNDVLRMGIRAKGQKELRKHSKGERLTNREIILAKCYECCGGYPDGRVDCGIPSCPLFPQMPYRGVVEEKTA